MSETSPLPEDIELEDISVEVGRGFQAWFRRSSKAVAAAAGAAASQVITEVLLDLDDTISGAITLVAAGVSAWIARNVETFVIDGEVVKAEAP